MNQVLKIALPGYNAKTNTNPDHFSLYIDGTIDNILIKEFLRGSGTVNDGNDATIPHNLGYIPFYLVYCEIGSNLWRIANAFDPIILGWRSYATNTSLIIQNRFSDTYNHYKYYIFYDNFT
jgi:hypothetical protein